MFLSPEQGKQIFERLKHVSEVAREGAHQQVAGGDERISPPDVVHANTELERKLVNGASIDDAVKAINHYESTLRDAFVATLGNKVEIANDYKNMKREIEGIRDQLTGNDAAQERADRARQQGQSDKNKNEERMRLQMSESIHWLLRRGLGYYQSGEFHRYEAPAEASTIEINDGERPRYLDTKSGEFHWKRLDGSNAKMTFKNGQPEFDNKVSDVSTTILGEPRQFDDIRLLIVIMNFVKQYQRLRQYEDYNTYLTVLTAKLAGADPSGTEISLGPVDGAGEQHRFMFAKLAADFGFQIKEYGEFSKGQQVELDKIYAMRDKEDALQQQIQDLVVQARALKGQEHTDEFQQIVMKHKELCNEAVTLNNEHYGRMNLHPRRTDCYGGLGRYKEMRDGLESVATLLGKKQDRTSKISSWNNYKKISEQVAKMERRLNRLTPKVRQKAEVKEDAVDQQQQKSKAKPRQTLRDGEAGSGMTFEERPERYLVEQSPMVRVGGPGR